MKMLISKDARIGVVFAHTIPAKGISVSEYNVECIIRDVRRLGYNWQDVCRGYGPHPPHIVKTL